MRLPRSFKQSNLYEDILFDSLSTVNVDHSYLHASSPSLNDSELG
jgi:hypothetical protein